MNLWETRNISTRWLDEEFPERSELIQKGYQLVNKSIDLFEEINLKEGGSYAGKFARVSGSIVVKSNNLSLACYSLTLDGLAQEAGAILRPLIESFELLTYLREDWNRVEEVLNDKLPSAGKIAQKIGGFHQNARDYLNENSSHFSFTYHSMRHVFDFNSGKFKRLPSHDKEVFMTNIRTLNAYQIFILMESISCLFVLGIDVKELSKAAELYRDKCVYEFKQPIK